MVERFFRYLTQDVVRDGSFASVAELVDAIAAYLAERNLEPGRTSGGSRGRRYWPRSSVRVRLTSRSPAATTAAHRRSPASVPALDSSGSDTLLYLGQTRVSYG